MEMVMIRREEVEIVNEVDLRSSVVKHSHDFLSVSHSSNEFRTWLVIVLTFASMVVEITCGLMFGSLALVADGIHMSTHAIAFFITAFAYSYSRKHANSPSYVFGTGKVGELAAYTSALILIGISLYILYDGIYRFIYPEEIIFEKALPVAFVGLSVNIASGFILGYEFPDPNKDESDVERSAHAHGHGHGHSHGHNVEVFEYDDEDFGLDPNSAIIKTPHGTLAVVLYEEDTPPEFRIVFHDDWNPPETPSFALTTNRPDGSTANFSFFRFGSILRSHQTVPEPHAFSAVVCLTGANESSEYHIEFKEEQDHHHEAMDNDEEADHHGHSHGHYAATALRDSHDHHHPGNSVSEHGHDHAHSVPSHSISGHDHAHSAGPCEDVEHGHHHQQHTVHVLNTNVSPLMDHSHGHDHGHHSHSFLDGHDHCDVLHSEQVLPSASPVSFHKEQPIAPSSSKKKPRKYEQDNNFRAAVIHVVADAFVSVLVIAAISIAGNVPNTLFLDPLVAVIGSFVILSWAATLMYDTSMNLLDVSPDLKLNAALRRVLERDGSHVVDLHVWRLGPGHLAAIVSVMSPQRGRHVHYYKNKLKGFKALSHVTIEHYEPADKQI